MSRWAAICAGTMAAALALGGALSCQLFVDVGGLSNGQCPARQKLCGGHCESETDPRYGCNSSSCVPCEFVNAYGACDPTTLACVPRACFSNYASCSSAPDAACATDLHHDIDNCGACNTPCPTVMNGIPGCTDGQCDIGGCSIPYEDCNHGYMDGCETNLSNNSANCGTCGYVCDAGTSCQGGVCSPTDAGGGN